MVVKGLLNKLLVFFEDVEAVLIEKGAHLLDLNQSERELPSVAELGRDDDIDIAFDDFEIDKFTFEGFLEVERAAGLQVIKRAVMMF